MLHATRRLRPSMQLRGFSPRSAEPGKAWRPMQDLESIFKRAHRELRPRTPIPEMRIEFFPFVGLNHTARLHDTRLVIRVSYISTDPPAEIYHSLALILLAKLYRKKIHHSYHRTYRKFVLSDRIQERARTIRNDRCRLARTKGAQGRY